MKIIFARQQKESIAVVLCRLTNISKKDFQPPSLIVFKLIDYK